MTLRLGDVAPDFQADTTEGRGSVSNEEAARIYPQGWKPPRPYMRSVPQPRS